jgi:predicted DCC family thiol-disulfide oxidoreductase YuxK
MSSQTEKQGVWFVYDGDCPICSHVAEALRIKDIYGPLHLVNAREDKDAPLLQEIGKRQLDLDEGMVIYCEDRFYHGKDALRFMAQHGADKGWFNRSGRILFQSDKLAAFFYPGLRGMRNMLLKIRNVPKLDNLKDSGEPVFKSVFGMDWHRLPPVMLRHYANRPYHDDVVVVEGCLKVESSCIGKLLKPLFRLARTLVPYDGENIPVTVKFVTDTRSNIFRFDRVFHFPGRNPYHFRSAMAPVRNNEILEKMRFGLCWRMLYSWNGEKVILSHKGYDLQLFGLLIPLPLALLIGKGHAEEIPVSDDEFSMMTEIRHPLWGKVYGYSGTFKIVKDR